MKKGVVFQMSGDSALVMEFGGDFRRVTAKNGWAVGDVVSLERPRKSRSVRYWLAHAAGIVLMLFTIQFGYNHYIGQTVTYISVEVNPSVEIAVNRLNRVVSTTSYNEDGATVLKNLDLNGQEYTAAVQALIECEEMQPYLDADPSVIVAVSSDVSRAAKLYSGLNGVASILTDESEDLTVFVSNVAWDLVDKAHEQGLTPGRLALFEQMKSEDENLTLEEFMNNSVSFLVKIAKDCDTQTDQ